MPREEIQAVTWRVGTQLAIGSALTLLLAVIAVVWLLRRKLRPLGDLVQQAQALGAGEIVLNCIDRDGVRRGYDIDQLVAARTRLTIPLVASGGAGSPDHFRQVFAEADVSGALAASVFHTGAIAIPDLKEYLADEGLEMRL